MGRNYEGMQGEIQIIQFNKPNSNQGLSHIELVYAKLLIQLKGAHMNNNSVQWYWRAKELWVGMCTECKREVRVK